mgnify:CR=1 FL=1
MKKLLVGSIAAVGAVLVTGCLPAPGSTLLQTNGYVYNSGWTPTYPWAMVPSQPALPNPPITASMSVTPRSDLLSGRYLEFAFDQQPDLGTTVKVYIDGGVLGIETNAPFPQIVAFKLVAEYKEPGWRSQFQSFSRTDVASESSCGGGPAVELFAESRYWAGDGGERLHRTVACDPNGQVRSWLDNGW